MASAGDPPLASADIDSFPTRVREHGRWRVVLESFGSSSLWEILQAHPGLELLPDEPFNESFAGWSPGNPDYLARIHDTESLDTVLAELFEHYRGIKVLSYQLDEELLHHLILRPDLWIIFLSRRNLLQTAVSDRIAKQTKLFNRWDASPEQPLARYYDSLEPLDLDDLRGYVRGLAPHLHWIESVLNLRNDGHTLQLRYEDLYFATPQAQRAQLSAIWSFLELTRSAHQESATTSIPRRRSWADGKPMASSRTRPRLMRPWVRTRPAGCSP